MMAYAQPLNPLVQKSEWGGVASELGGTSVQTAGEQSGVTYTADGRPLYESASDTIYIYNALQTAVSRQEDAADQPVLTGDGDAKTFGTGQPIYAAGSDEPLTYSPEHTYVYADGWDEGLEDAGDNNNVVVSDEPEDQEESDAEKDEQAEKDEPVEKNDAAGKDVVETEPTEDSAEKSTESDEVDLLADGDETEAYNSLSGRDYVGQVTKQIGDETYILIGNEQQLRAIGSNKDVRGATYKRSGVAGFFGDWKLDYVGDADLAAGVKLSGKTPNEVALTTEYCGCGNDGQMDASVSHNTGLRYASDANYIIFRDIDLNGTDWTPITFSGTMIGAKSSQSDVAGSLFSLVSQDGSGVTSDDVAKPVISNMTVNQDSTIKSNDYVGVGFFGTITNVTDEWGLTVKGGKAVAANFILKDAKVTSNATEVDADASGLVGWLVGWLLDLILGKSEDSSHYATGVLAGRVVGEVSLEGVEVASSTVRNNTKGYTGGLVGYSTGSTQYEGLSEALGDLTQILADILNIIPGLGLGDLITILLGDDGLVDVSKLIPVGYKAPVISGCKVIDLNSDGSAVGNEKNSFAGGFAGALIGTVTSGSSVSGGAISVVAKSYAGGFAGVVRNGSVEGTLDLSRLAQLELWDYTPQSLVYDSHVYSGVSASAQEDYAGGFAGGLANAYMVNDTVDTQNPVNVTAGRYGAGGFAGVASLGWQVDLGKGDGGGTTVGSLLGQVNDLLSAILSGKHPGTNPDPLLSLVGIKETELLGTQVRANGISVSAQKNAGGLLGEGDGTVIASTHAAVDGGKQGETYWNSEVPNQLKKHLGLSGDPVDQGVVVSGLVSVSASDANAGGIAGSLNVASGGGLVNNTLGLNNLIPFVMDSVDVSGDGFTVSAAGDYAAGGVGVVTGGHVRDVEVKGVSAITASNYAGGFFGASGTGSVVSGGGINLLGLNLVQINNLLQVGAAVQTTVDTVTVSGVGAGMKVTATGDGTSTDAGEKPVTAGGFVALGSATAVSSAHVTNLASVSANVHDGAIAANGQAGGFVGESTASGLADVADKDSILNLVKINGLLGAVTYLLPTYTDVDVSFVGEASVKADSAGGFAGTFEAGTVDNSEREEARQWAVYGIDEVLGGAYAGGFGGNVYSGALADASKGISILGDISGLEVDVAQLLNLIGAYVPTIKGAGVSSSERGLKVSATIVRDGDSSSGSAGGFIGCGSGVQISESNVSVLRSTTVTEPEDLEATEAPTYFDDDKSEYAVMGARYAGGYIGMMNIGSAASVGKGIGILGSSIQLTDLVDALQVVTSTIEHSNVTGAAGGFSVRASAQDASAQGDAGGFAGIVLGGHIQDANAYNFSHIIGQRSAGGYAGEIAPGAVADVLGEGGILNGLADVSSLLSLVQVFVPSVRNSETTAVPCGGVVRAQALSDASHLRGMAGGYVGHNEGGQIWGNNGDPWKTATDPYTGPQREAAAVRIRSVYGAEFAGGFTGLMEAADTAKTGSLGLLWGLISVDNLLGALGVAYPTEENTAVYGPLAKLDPDTWNSWVEHVGKHGGYGEELADAGKVDSQVALDALLGSYVYGMSVVAGRTAVADAGEANPLEGGSAGGYVGAMVSGTVTNGQAHDVRQVRGMRSAGGFAGSAQAGGAATLGSVDLLGGSLNFGQLLGVAQVFVPVIKSSSVEGYRAGMTVTSPGAGSRKADTAHATGNAGGYIGYGAGAQIWGDAQEAAEGEKDGASDAAACRASNLRRVEASAYAGGYAGLLTSGSAASVGTSGVSDGFLQELLDTIIGGTGIDNLVSVLQTTMSTVRGASVSAADSAWGFTVEGVRTDTVTYPIAAGGFVGMDQATVLGSRDGESDPSSHVTVSDLRGVDGGLYAGGFVGVAQTGGVAEVSAGTGEGSQTSILDLLKLGDVSVIQAFQPVIYDAATSGVADGVTVRAHTWDKGGLLSSQRVSGNAGGFAGTIMGGMMHRCGVSGLSSVSAPNYSGGFVGYTGKTGIANVKDVSALGELLGVTAGVANVIGTTVEDCSVAGKSGGFTVVSQGTGGATPENGATGAGEQMAGGFVGYADVSHVTGSNVTNLKLVKSPQAAGGFAATTSYAYLVNAQVDSKLVDALLQVVTKLLQALRVGDLENLDVIEISLGGEILELKVLSEGDTLSVTLLGIDVKVSLVKGTGDGQTDVVNVTIGDSTITLPVNEDGTIDTDQAKAELQINLIKGNRTVIEKSSVTGISDGYDVFGGGATQTGEAQEGATSGYAGGFVGHNNEGRLFKNDMRYADVVSGSADKTGPFTGATSYSSNWWFNDVTNIEQGNTYHVYRDPSLAQKNVEGVDPDAMNVSAGQTDGGDPADQSSTEAVWARFDVSGHRPVNGTNHEDWKGATVGGAPLGVYASAGKAVLMDDAAVSDNTGGLTPEPGDGQDPCEALVNVTIQKVWNDGGNRGGTRPESITVTLTASYTDANNQTVVPEEIQRTDLDGNPVGKPISNPMTVTLSGKDASVWSETWRKVVEDLPVAFRDEDGTLHYYTYTASEVEGLGGNYTASYETDSKENVITITNSLPLPDTGGMGTTLFLFAGLATLALGGIWLDQQRRRRAAAQTVWRPTGTHFRD
ncbi:Cna B-type domain-containing protein [Collinsella tanakaei]|nr:Cna B-type domain-containing protein [Collinsella tanakaei]